ncbi:nucleotide exchange factor GrpE [Streptomyces sp. APSN-46.1]|uniref:nucleotide exchange factor GrpE n=1 Tax=Streptomyces sp. APSN-46.1 TaxID=2929049 RepID=UPI001FB536C5|nr:nucleotide exchange factor GrpE [Streptomyces sp. APSN-46.1]MCJ1676057.1 nucleotide exchange factor GrpE [Streptomyces sp. APSN-46.1]
MNRPDDPQHPDLRRTEPVPPVLVRDRRRGEPLALTPRRPTAGLDSGQGPAPAAAPEADERVRGLEAELAERTEDLQRLKADYDNYRKRVHRDRLAVREAAVTNVLTGMLPVLDAVDQARRDGDASPGLDAVAHTLESHLARLGLQTVGEPGEPFDPRIHEAVASAPTTGAATPTCSGILRPGYRVGAHLLRPAQVVVAEPRYDGPLPPSE